MIGMELGLPDAVCTCSSVIIGYYFYLHFMKVSGFTLLHSERPELNTILAFLSAIGLISSVSIVS